VCCSTLRELLDLLVATPADPGSVLLIEANGATETDELLGHLTTDPRLAHVTLPLQLTVVDVARWQKRWWHNGLEVAQVRTATQVTLNWLDRVAAARRDAVTAAVRALNPRAELVTVESFADRLHAMVRDVTADPTRAGRGATGEPGRAPSAGPAADAAATTHAPAATPARPHAHPFGSVVLPLPPLVERAPFGAFVHDLPASVVRAKGLVRFADRPAEMFVWNRVPGRRGLTLDRSAPHDDAEATALFIGVGMPVEDLRSRIAALGGVS
jgi:G3E family GTPase